jgi:hypothetical protein
VMGSGLTVVMIVAMVAMMGGMMAGAVWVWVRKIAKRGEQRSDQSEPLEAEAQEPRPDRADR